MALEKRSIEIPFGLGVDTKTDPKQVQIGKLLELSNVVFGLSGALVKRDGFGLLSTLPNDAATSLVTLNGNLLATGSELYEYNAANDIWTDQGLIQPVTLTTYAMSRVSATQLNPDMAVASNNLACLVWMEGAGAYYQITDMSTGQAVVGRTLISASGANPRVNILGQNFIISFVATVGGSPHLQYIAIPIQNVTSPGTATDVTTAIGALTSAYDAVVLGNTIYWAWNANDGGGAVRLKLMTSTLALSSEVVYATYVANLISITADSVRNLIFVSWYRTSSSKTFTLATDALIGPVLAPTETQTAVTLSNIASYASAGTCTVLSQIENTYSGSGARTDYITRLTCTSAGVVSSATTVLRGVGLASKPFTPVAGSTYVAVSYGGALQPTYFVINMSGNIILKLAYQNGGGYYSANLPNSVVVGDDIYLPYLFKDLLVPVADRLGSGTNFYSQTGINAVRFQINTQSQLSAEVAGSLHLTGGQLWQYDGVKPVEHGFHVFAESISNTTSTTTGNMSAQIYKYQFTYEWTDAAGNIHRSAPSIPYTVDLSASGTATNKVTLKVPTLRLTAKTGANKVRIVGYRWSTAQQLYYQFTSVTSPTLNDTSVDEATIVDVESDANILGNTLLYTTGGIVENIAMPAASGVTLLRNRLWAIDAENKNQLFYSKILVQGEPVEMSDVFTYFVAPAVGAQGDTGPCQAIAGMDDKLIVFKRNAILYVTGTGPDATGANNDFSEPIFITSTVGTSNPRSVVSTPLGLMFQSDKGIWLLARNLATTYVGAPVEAYTQEAQVKSALVIPGTTQIRFTMDSGLVLMYDYYYDQWGSFTGIPSIASTLYDGLQTNLNQYGQVLQETPGQYLDISKPVLIKFKTAWLKLSQLQGFQRAYWFYLLGTYYSPHMLNVQLAYDYDPSTLQQVNITPTNYSAPFGEDSLFGGSEVFGGPSNVEQWQVYLNKQKCQAIQITLQEMFDPSYGTVAGQGLSLSGINMVIGGKNIQPKLPASQRTG